jgi:LysM repeat protein
MEIEAKEAAIKKRLDAANKPALTKAKADVAKDLAKLKAGGKSGTAKSSYTTQGILGSDKGFTKSDYGVGDNSGAAIPYQIGNSTKTVTTKYTAPYKPKPIPKTGPAKSSNAKPSHTVYKVKKGDTLSGIAKKHGMNWKDIWNYNLKNRSSKTVKTLKSRGPNLIYRGGSFYIPNK